MAARCLESINQSVSVQKAKNKITARPANYNPPGRASAPSDRDRNHVQSFHRVQGLPWREGKLP